MIFLNFLIAILGLAFGGPPGAQNNNVRPPTWQGKLFLVFMVCFWV